MNPTLHALALLSISLAFPTISSAQETGDMPDSASVEKVKSVAQDLIFRSVEMDNRIRIREATNSLRQKPEIAATLERIANGTTSEEIRLARIDYYNALDKGLKAALPDLKERISDMTSGALARLAFHNVRSREEVAAELSR